MKQLFDHYDLKKDMNIWSVWGDCAAKERVFYGLWSPLVNLFSDSRNALLSSLENKEQLK